LGEEGEHEAHCYEDEEGLGGVQADLDILELRLGESHRGMPLELVAPSMDANQLQHS
jgi:hypothetical protein